MSAALSVSWGFVDENPRWLTLTEASAVGLILGVAVLAGMGMDGRVQRRTAAVVVTLRALLGGQISQAMCALL